MLTATKEFLQKTKNASDQLKDFKDEIDNREESIVSLIESFRQKISTPIIHGTEAKNELAKKFDESLQQTINGLASWSKIIEKSITAKEFISRFDRSMIVCVYGKVNSGKSSLGNFLAGVPFKNLEDNPYKDIKNTIRIHDQAGSREIKKMIELEDPKEGFEVKSTEATSCIQEFTLGGLSWIDTPGIDSNTTINDELARDYVENAELVVYITSSDSPARKSDIENLKQMQNVQKPLLITLTKSDTTEFDEDEDGEEIILTIPKSAKNRKDQHDYVKKVILDEGLDKVLVDQRICSTSVRIAKKSFKENDSKLFAESALPDFYQQLGQVLDENAIELKKRNPRKRINAMIEEISQGFAGQENTSLKDLQKSFSQLGHEGKSSSEKLCSLKDGINRRVIGGLQTPISKLINKASHKFRETKQVKSLQKKLNKLVQNSVSKVIAEEISQVFEEFDKKALSAFKFDVKVGHFKDKTTKTKTSTKDRNKGYGAATGALLGLVTFIPAVNVGVWGAMVIGTVGTYIGSKIGEKTASEEDVITVVGTNVDEVLANVMKDLEEKIPLEVDDILGKIAEDTFTRVVLMSQNITDLLKQLEANLTELKYEDM